MSQILVIEDEPMVLENILETLSFEGFSVVGAANGAVGLKAARENLPDLIICDIAMPEMDGYEVLFNLQKDPATMTIPFIFLTARVERLYMRKGMELGADDYITKPFDPDELVDAVQARLEKRQAYVHAAEESLADVKKQLVHTIAHELRTPLSNIIMGLSLVNEQMNDASIDELRRYVHYINAGGMRLRHLTEQMILTIELDTGALSREKLDAFSLEVTVRRLLNTASESARDYAFQNEAGQVSLDFSDGAAEVAGDARALEHAFAELITNALNFSPDGEPVKVSQWVEGAQVWVSIRDNGPGMDKNQIEVALRDFSQLDRERNEQQGIGIGLPLARRVIEVHGGSMTLKSAPGKGTEVLVALPRYAE